MKDFREFLLESVLERMLVEKSNWDVRKEKNGKERVKKEYEQHKKRRNETGDARTQYKRKSSTKRGKAQAAHRDAVRRAEEQGKLIPPIGKPCPKCRKIMKTRKDMVRDATHGYSKENQLKGQYICRTCHNKKDNNKPGEKTTKGKMRTNGLGSISKESGDNHIKKASN